MDHWGCPAQVVSGAARYRNGGVPSSAPKLRTASQTDRWAGMRWLYHHFMGALLYLDVCCLKRPFDDQRAERVRLESAAVAGLIDRAERRLIALVRSPAHRLENDKNPREDRRLAAALWLEGATVAVDLSENVASRARTLETLGFGALDALHAAFAEAAGAAWLATTDDRLLALGKKHRDRLAVSIVNPVHVLKEVEGGEG